MAVAIEGIFLSKRKHTSGSLITTFLTKDGLMTFYFRGGEKKSAVLYPLATGAIVYSPNPRSDLKNMSGFEIVGGDSFIQDPRKIAIAFFIVELLMKCTAENNPDEELISVVSQLRFLLNEEDKVNELPLIALTSLMDPLGIQVAMSFVKRENLVFDLNNGEIRHGIESPVIPGGMKVELITSLLLNEQDKRYDRHTRREALNLLLSYYSDHFPGVTALKSLEVLYETMS